MKKLILGIVDFRERLLPQYADRFRGLAKVQAPDALFITCADSRVVPNLLVSTDPGELFTMRNVGNLIPPATEEGLSTGDLSEASAIEYAVSVLQVEDIVVCGHSECGAMKAVLAPSHLDDAPNLAKWLHHADGALFRLKQDRPQNGTLKLHDELSRLNVLVQRDHLMTYPAVRSAVEANRLRLSAWWFDIATGDMYAYESERQSYTLIERSVAERLTRDHRSTS
ncbi:carbonic anhydrase [Enhydrobacter aerosaccus]|uniref:Carbonic anhydrase n=1 Tax=Enhydrobacter aerosaccus TaxID=225324 RepID=A0A1T4NII0_9HYPH|nr:carbonic anhydrase [Enhydrobacter aerosaccus]SJZ79052.1 carbonic anhydrase [Enhydrobacter aerosaccus]